MKDGLCAEGFEQLGSVLGPSPDVVLAVGLDGDGRNLHDLFESRFVARALHGSGPCLSNLLLVGPRPPLKSEVDLYGDEARRRLLVKPGMTGLWQVSGRSDLTWDDTVRLDVYYVENWSITGDMVIIWKTAKAVVSSSGAY